MTKIILACSSLLLSTLAIATPTIQEETLYYKISGNTADQLREQMNTLGPIDHTTHADAQTTWHITWKFYWQHDTASQNLCHLTGVSVNASITKLYPKWINENSAAPALQNKWNTYLTNLATHESGHAENGKRTAIEIEKALLDTPLQSNCRLLVNTLNAAAYSVIAQHNKWDIQYDADTQHGRTQGAVFPR